MAAAIVVAFVHCSVLIASITLQRYNHSVCCATSCKWPLAVINSLQFLLAGALNKLVVMLTV